MVNSGQQIKPADGLSMGHTTLLRNPTSHIPDQAASFTKTDYLTNTIGVLVSNKCIPVTHATHTNIYMYIYASRWIIIHALTSSAYTEEIGLYIMNYFIHVVKEQNLPLCAQCIIWFSRLQTNVCDEPGMTSLSDSICRGSD